MVRLDCVGGRDIHRPITLTADIISPALTHQRVLAESFVSMEAYCTRPSYVHADINKGTKVAHCCTTLTTATSFEVERMLSTPSGKVARTLNPECGHGGVCSNS